MSWPPPRWRAPGPCRSLRRPRLRRVSVCAGMADDGHPRCLRRLCCDARRRQDRAIAIGQGGRIAGSKKMSGRRLSEVDGQRRDLGGAQGRLVGGLRRPGLRLVRRSRSSAGRCRLRRRRRRRRRRGGRHVGRLLARGSRRCIRHWRGRRQFLHQLVALHLRRRWWRLVRDRGEIGESSLPARPASAGADAPSRRTRTTFARRCCSATEERG